MMWADFSAWLVTVGVDCRLSRRHRRADRNSCASVRRTAGRLGDIAIGNAVVLILATFNMLVHTRDAWTSVVPWGLTLSAAIVLVLLFTGWMARETDDVYRHGVGVARCFNQPSACALADCGAGALVRIDAALTGVRRGHFRPDEPGRPQSGPARAAAVSLPADAPRPVVGWKQGETPTVAAGLKIEALATGPAAPALALRAAEWRRAGRRIQSPRTSSRSSGPKDMVMGWIESLVTSGGGDRAEQSHHAAARRERRRQAGDRRPLPRPSQLAVRRGAGRHRPLRRQHRRHRALSLHDGRHQDHGSGHAADAASRAGRSTTTGPRAWWRAPTARCSMSASARTATSPRTASRRRRTAPRSGRWTAPPVRWRIFAERPAQPERPDLRAARAARYGRSSTSATSSAPNLVPDYMTSVKDGGFYGWPYSYYGQHVDPRVQPQRPDLVEKAIAPDYALSSHVAPLGLTFYTGGQPAAAIPRRRVRRRARQLGPARASMATRSYSCRSTAAARTARPRMSSPAF